MSDPGLVVEQVPIDDLIPDPANPRRMDEAEQESLTRSIQQFGFAEPIAARREDKRVIITWGANWCGWCHKLDTLWQAEPEIQELSENHFVSVHIDLGYRDKHMDLLSEYELENGKLRTPHLTILDQEGDLVGQHSSATLVQFQDGTTVYSKDRVMNMLNKRKSR